MWVSYWNHWLVGSQWSPCPTDIQARSGGQGGAALSTDSPEMVFAHQSTVPAGTTHKRLLGHQGGGYKGWRAPFLHWPWFWGVDLLLTNVTCKVASAFGEGRGRLQVGFGEITRHAPHPLQARKLSFKASVTPFHFFFSFCSLWALKTCTLLLHSNFPELYLED